MKPEILSPVGNTEMLYQAVHNGADAVYLGGLNYGARKYANNFTNDDLEKAVTFAHLYDVKVYVTVNTMIYEKEVKGLIEYIKYLVKINVDALIISDIGMINLLHNMFPNLEMHASTQCHIHNNETAKYYKQLGTTRVVLSREMSKEEIKNIDGNIEKEIFVHGALCICYSGCCLFSSLNGSRSGNRGMCTAPCRMPYELYKGNIKIDTKGKYLLSTKDLNLSQNIKDVLEVKPCSIKIEGRMKSPEYVGYITRVYRKLIDSYYTSRKLEVTDEEIINMKKIYNRGFTKGHFLSDNILNPYLPNNSGVEIGTVIDVNPKFIRIKLKGSLSLQDGIKFYPSDSGLTITKIINNDKKSLSNASNIVISIPNTINLKSKDKVLKTTDKTLINELSRYNRKKLDLNIKVIAKLGKKLYIEFQNNNIIKSEEGILIEQSKKVSTTKEEITRAVTKLGETPYEANKVEIIIDDNIFIPISSINKIRQALVEQINEEKLRPKRKIIINPPPKIITNKTDNKTTISAYVKSEEILKTCLSLNIDNIYTDDFKLYKKYQKLGNVYYNVSRALNKYEEYANENLLVSDYGAIQKYAQNNNVITDYTLNIANNYSISLLTSQNIKKICLSLEMTSNDIKNIKRGFNTEMIIYGTVELMVIKSNILNISGENYYLKSKDRKYKLKVKDGNTYIYHHQKINNINKIKELNIKNYRLDFFDESKEEVIKIINKVRKELK